MNPDESRIRVSPIWVSLAWISTECHGWCWASSTNFILVHAVEVSWQPSTTQEISQPGEIHGLSWSCFFCDCTRAHDTSMMMVNNAITTKNSKKGSERKVWLKTNSKSAFWSSIRPAVQWKGRCQPSVTSWSALPWSNFRRSVDLTKLANDASEEFEFWSNRATLTHLISETF